MDFIVEILLIVFLTIVKCCRFSDEDSLTDDATSSATSLQSQYGLPTWKLPVLPVQLLVRPFQKRFIFHFCGKLKTNNREKVCIVDSWFNMNLFLTSLYLFSYVVCNSLISLFAFIKCFCLQQKAMTASKLLFFHK